jgi:hypothetical protein
VWRLCELEDILRDHFLVNCRVVWIIERVLVLLEDIAASLVVDGCGVVDSVTGRQNPFLTLQIACWDAGH